MRKKCLQSMSKIVNTKRLMEPFHIHRTWFLENYASSVDETSRNEESSIMFSFGEVTGKSDKSIIHNDFKLLAIQTEYLQ